MGLVESVVGPHCRRAAAGGECGEGEVRGELPAGCDVFGEQDPVDRSNLTAKERGTCSMSAVEALTSLVVSHTHAARSKAILL